QSYKSNWSLKTSSSYIGVNGISAYVRTRVTASSQGCLPFGVYTAILGAFSKMTDSIFWEGLEISSKIEACSLSEIISKLTPLILHSLRISSASGNKNEPPL